MEHPEVSVVMATRDRPHLLRRAVASALAQDLAAPIEIVLVYDGTPIDTLEDLPRPSNRSVRAVQNSRTPGLAGARNTGILAAKAPRIAFCDDDDEWTPTKLRRQLPLLDEPGTILAATGIEIQSSGGSHVRLPPPTVELDDLLRSRITALHPSSFVYESSALLGDLGLVDEDLPGGQGEDYDMLLRAARLGPVRSITEPLTIIHWDRTSYFTVDWQRTVDGLGYLLDKHEEFRRTRVGRSRLEGQIAFAHGALGDRPSARSWAARALRNDFRQHRAYLALLVGSGLVSGERVMAELNKRGRGV